MNLLGGLQRLYGQADKNLFGGALPGGADSPNVGASRSLENRTPKYTPRQEAVKRSKARTSQPSTASKATAITYGGGGGGAPTQVQDNRTPLERAPIGQVMTLGGVKGYKGSDGKWHAGNPDAAAVEASPQGVIPVPTFGTEGYAAAGYLKSLAGPLGRPFKILKNQDQIDFEDRTKVVGRQDDGSVVFNRDTAIAAGMEPEYDELGTNMGNKVLGRYTTKQGTDGSDIATDVYDTNRSVKYHAGKIFGSDSSLGERVSSAIALPHKALDNIGWTNPSPYGTQQIVGTPGTMSAPNTAPQPVQQTVPSDPATNSNYTVQSGDTLTEIARRQGTTVQELMRKNSIRNANIISVGQQLKY